MARSGGTAAERPSYEGMAWIPGGIFRMGSERHYAEEAPVHTVEVDGFWMDVDPVTNAEFSAFVHATGYVTVAERLLNPNDYPGGKAELMKPGGLVFQPSSGPVDLRDYRNWWAYVPGANWRHPMGPRSSIAGKASHPVVQVVHEDAAAYAAWARKQLPSEAEWEFAARGGLDGAHYCWGDEFMPGGRIMANTWHGEFPWENHSPHGFRGTSPVRSFPANSYGLYDTAGNVWEWTDDWYAAKHTADAANSCCAPLDPRGDRAEASRDASQPHVRMPRKVVKGGSHLCAPNYCLRYRPAARQPQMIDTGTCHIGFRCIRRERRSP
ncbi:MAG TPA: formylglycine-generating enzyme family protein [Stellaceae bacterium]|nr:formylglycine-generating enzyme family protein [Stellaceae bacterium]